MQEKVRKTFEKMKDAHIAAGKTADWINSWENAFMRTGGDKDAKPIRRTNPKGSSNSNNLRVDQSSADGADGGRGRDGRQGVLPSAAAIRAGEGVRPVKCPCRLY